MSKNFFFIYHVRRFARAGLLQCYNGKMSTSIDIPVQSPELGPWVIMTWSISRPEHHND